MRRLTIWAVALACAALVAQLPAFAQQYTQRLGGAVDELAAQLAALDARAGALDLDRNAYVRRFLANPDPVIRAEGDNLAALMGRHLLLSRDLEALRAAPAGMRGLAMLGRLDPGLAWRTAADFRPALPLSLEGALHAGAGLAMGWVLGWAGWFVLRRRPRPRREPRLGR